MHTPPAGCDAGPRRGRYPRAGRPAEKGPGVARLAAGSANPGKLGEYRELLPDHDLVPVAADVDETEPTYEGNALLKARAAAAASGLVAFADDTGLELEALGGFPGLHTRRIAETQEQRIAVLHERLAAVPEPWRARFVCVLAVVRPGGGGERVFRGVLEGRFLRVPRGGAGFGYDPWFEVEGRRLTLAEMPEEKNRLGHRGRAVAEARAAGWL